MLQQVSRDSETSSDPGLQGPGFFCVRADCSLARCRRFSSRAAAPQARQAAGAATATADSPSSASVRAKCIS
ncbi:MAG TPA: hypothetical protein DC058_13230, partial [Planctomycetaceae bacterium]|nr:hypothetical protein [Planctomycetaceae bacterium]